MAASWDPHIIEPSVCCNTRAECHGGSKQTKASSYVATCYSVDVDEFHQIDVVIQYTFLHQYISRNNNVSAYCDTTGQNIAYSFIPFYVMLYGTRLYYVIISISVSISTSVSIHIYICHIDIDVNMCMYVYRHTYTY